MQILPKHHLPRQKKEKPLRMQQRKSPLKEESREITLDEWKALRNNRAKPQYNLRKAGEGEDLSRWKKMYALEKKEGRRRGR